MISFEQIINKVNKYKMDIKQIYREETDLEPFHKSYGDYGSYDDKYVKWLEAKINYTHCCTELKDKTGYNNIDDFDPSWIHYINGNKKTL